MNVLRQRLLVAAVIATLVAVCVAVLAPRALAPAYRLAVFACLAPALGSLLFSLIHQLTGGQWGLALRPFLAAGSLLAPWVWLAAAPLLFFSQHDAPAWPAYESPGMLALRAAAYALVLFAVARPLSRLGAKPAGWVGPAGLLGLVFTLHLLAEDWLAALDPHWHSTAFPLVWMVGAAVAGLACAILAALGFDATRRPALDWGNLLLAAMLFWSYVAFAQFLVIWSGNLPREIEWFLRRTRDGWVIVPPLLGLLHFALPFAVLLSRAGKRSRRPLLAVAATLLLAQLLHVAWIILPAFSLGGPLGWTLVAALLAAAAALFANRYLTAAQHRLDTP